MNHPNTPFYILIGISVVLTIGALIRPTWPLLAVAVLLTDVAILILVNK